MSINIIRARTKLKELFENKIDMTDFPNDTGYHFETRAIAALSLMMTTGLDAEQSAIHITDGFHDMGIDAIYLDSTQKELFLVQSKWRNDGIGGISQPEMQTFVEGVKRIIEFDITGANAKIQSKKEDIDFALTSMNYQIHMIFAHTGNESSTEYVRRPLNNLLSAVNDEISTLLVYSELSFKEIYEFLAQGQTPNSVCLDDVILTNWGKIETPYPVFYGTVSAAAVGEWYRTYGNTLFSKNLRFYKGDTDVNEGMRKTLLNEPENFFYYNNGLKLLCNSITRKAKDSTTNSTGLFRLDGVSLVNGAQTTGTIGSAFMDNPEQVSKANVMIQIVDLHEAPEEAYLQITKLTNTQNRIENKDFVALDPEQERIRTDLSFSHYTYLYKSGDKLTNMDDQLTFDEAVVALACLNEDLSFATLAKRNVGGLSEDISKAPYKVLFNPSTNSFSLLNSVLIIRQVEKNLLKKKEQLTGRERLVAVHGNRFLSYCILQSMKTAPEFEKSILDIAQISQEVESHMDTYFPKAVACINTLYPESYPANIFKNTTKCKAILEQVNAAD